MNILIHQMKHPQTLWPKLEPNLMIYDLNIGNYIPICLGKELRKFEGLKTKNKDEIPTDRI